MKQKTNKGITLIALVITIIVMLILVAVTISMAVNGGLFSYASKAVGDTNNAYANEQSLGSGAVIVDGKEYESIDDYLAGNEKVVLPTGWSKATTLPTGYNWDTTKVTPIVDNATTPHYVPLPKGYSISSVAAEQGVETGLVIKDSNGNEFVWVPVTGTLSNPYTGGGSGYSEPTALSGTWSGSTQATKPAYDSQSILDELYGTNYFTYTTDFNYASEYATMKTQVEKYHGFYIGRYETTIETIDGETKIGCVNDRTVLTADKIMFSKTVGDTTTNYPYRWYGLYYASKTTNYIIGNGTNVQSAMIYGQLWDKTMEYIRTQKTALKTSYTVDTATSTWHGSSNGHTGVVNSGKANAADVALNIYDLESNALEWTQWADPSYSKVVFRGGSFQGSMSAASIFFMNRTDTIATGSGDFANLSSRLALYIK